MSSTDSRRPTADLAGVVAFAGAVEAARLRGTLSEAIGAGVGETAFDGPVVLGDKRGTVDCGDGLLCAFDGRLANRTSLAGSLGLPAEALPARIVAAAYRRWSQDAVERLQGEFVFALWDPKRAQSLLACDPLGARSLFFHTAGGRLTFATEVGAVLQLLPTRPDIDDHAALQWLALGAIAGGRTLYAGIQRLDAGTALTFDRHGLSKRCYWRPCYRRPLGIDPEEAARQVRDRLRVSIAERLRGRDKVGILLSGGLDSSMVAAVAREAAPDVELVGYSMTFPELPSVDESRLVDTISEHLGITSVQMRVRGGSMLAGGVRFLERWGLPTPAPNVTFITALQSFAVGAGTTVMLDGEGGDELFGTDSFLLGHLLRRGRVQTAWRICRELPRHGERSTVGATARAFWTLGVHGAVPFPLQRFRRSVRAEHDLTPPWLTEAAAERLRGDVDPFGWKRSHAPLWWSHLSHVLTTDRERIGVSDGLRHIGAISGLERQHPLLGLDVVELILQLPPEYAFRHRLDRAVQRAAMKSLVPDAVVERPDKSFFTPLLRRSLLGGELSVVRKLVESPTAEIRRFVDQRTLSAHLDTIGSPGEAVSMPLYVWRLTMMEAWLRAQAAPDFAARFLSEMSAEPARVEFVTHARPSAVRRPWAA